MVTNGMFAPGASGTPLTQLIMISPVCSVNPSPRNGVLFVACALHCSCCAKASPVNRASTANTVTTLRKLTISFLLLVNFELNRSKLSLNLSLKNLAVKIRSANLGNFSVSGGESFSESRLGDRASLKTSPAAHDRYFLCPLCSQVQIQNCR